MKTLIVSDLHLTEKWDEKKAQFLVKLFSSADNIIMNGDFWDGERTYFERFIASRWSVLFPILKSKKTVYLFGNHDLEKYNDSRMSLFSDEQKDFHIHKEENYSCHIEHGHLLFRTLDIALHLPRKVLFVLSAIAQPIEAFFVNHGSIHNHLIRFSNVIMKRRMHPKRKDMWYVCGHTHYPELDHPQLYANSGFIQHGKATYLIATPEGLSLHTEWYK